MLDYAQTKPKRIRPPQPPLKLAMIYWGTVLLVGVTVLLGVAAAYSWRRVMPGVAVLDIDVGGQTQSRAALALEQGWASHKIVIHGANVTWDASPPMLGLVLDVESTIQRAYEQSRTPEHLVALLRGERSRAVAPVWRLDPTLAEASLEVLKTQIEVPPTDAGIRVTGAQIEVIPPVPGRTLDVAATLKALQERGLYTVEQGQFDLVLAPVPPEITNVDALAARLRDWFVHPFTIRAYDPVADDVFAWEAPADVWAGWMALELDPRQQDTFGWELDADQVQAFLTAQAAALGAGRRLDLTQGVQAVQQAFAAGNWGIRLRVYHDERQHVIQSGETISSIARAYGIPYPWIQQRNPAAEGMLRPGQTLVIPSADVLLPLPIVESKRIVVSIQQQAMWAYENGALLWQWPVSTGIESSPTSPGVFQILSHEANAYAASWNLWMPYFMGIYRPVPTSQFTNGFHGFPTRDGANLLWTRNLGYPVTFGCILLSTQNAATLFEWAEEGVVVEIRP